MSYPNISLKMLHPIFVHRIWECAGVDLLGVFDAEHFADTFARALMDGGSEPERTCIVSCNTYTGEMKRFMPTKAKDAAA